MHEIITNGQRLAMRFSEHGRSAKHSGRAAVWSGLGLYRWNGARLVENFVEQDYLARRRQLASGPPGTDSPALAPWDTIAQPADPAAEAVVRDWISADMASDVVVFDDGDTVALLTEAAPRIDDLFSAGGHVAFRLTSTGRYTGGLGADAGLDDAAHIGKHAVLHLVGLVTVAGGQVTGGTVVRDRLGLARGLRNTGLDSDSPEHSASSGN